jgi:hypothetical protein
MKSAQKSTSDTVLIWVAILGKGLKLTACVI